MRHSFVTGAAAVAYSLSPGIGFQLREVRIHLDAVGGAGNLTISCLLYTSDAGEADRLVPFDR